MSEISALSIDDVLSETEALISNGIAHGRSYEAEADRCLAMGEAVMESWLHSKDQEPTRDCVEGFRLLALHRQGAKGDPSFNACRETCREIVYLRNVIQHEPQDEKVSHRLRLCAMTVRHLALFIGGKLQEAGLGEFCCSSKGLRASKTTVAHAPERQGA